MDIDAINAELSAITTNREYRNLIMKLDPNTGGGQIFGYNIEGVAPAGQVIAVCLDIRDQMGVDRKKFQSEEMEKQDVTRFLFGFLDPQGQPWLVQTFEFKISGNSGSNLVDFLKAWTSRDPYGFDYLELKGTGAMITVGVKQSTRTPGKWYNTITAVSPVYPTLQAQIPHPTTFAALLTKALSAPPMQNNQQGRPAASGPPPGYGQPPAQQPPPQGVGFAGHGPLPPAANVRKFWVQAPGAAQAVEATGDQVAAGLLKYPQGLLICPMDAPHVGWVAPAQLGIFPPQAQQPPAPPDPAMPPLPPPPSHNPWPQNPAPAGPPAPPAGGWGPPPGGTVPGVTPGHGMPAVPGSFGAPPPAPGGWQQPPAVPSGPPPQDDIPF